MKNKTQKRSTKIAVILTLIAALVAGIAVMPLAQASVFTTAPIQKLDNVKVNYTDYFDSSVVQPLPQRIRDDETISVCKEKQVILL